MNPMGIQDLPLSVQVLLRSVCSAPIVPLVPPRLILTASSVIALRDAEDFSIRPLIPLGERDEYQGQPLTIAMMKH